MVTWFTDPRCLGSRRRHRTVLQVHSDKYYVLGEQDDEGVFYLFQLADNKVVSFGGQDF
jgi:hypothetical protein